jgi:dihydrofolate synthase/folylpolyglutamate synthase
VVDTINNCQLPAHPTFFEIITATAFSYFAEQAIQLGILEVGMGGRLDSTNAVNPIFSIITPISFDHQQYLGDTLPLIASEKAGVMRQGGTVVSAPQFPEVEKTLRDSARYLGASLRYIELDSFAVKIKDSGYSQFTRGGITYNLGVPGKFQATNALVAIEAIEELEKRGFAIDSVHCQRGIEKSRFSAVVQILKKDPLVILDGGHNLAAIESLCQFTRDYTPEPRILVFGMMKDKAIAPVLDVLKPFFSIIYLTQADRVRAASVEKLAQFCPEGIPEKDPGSAYMRALGHNSTVVVTGSLHLVGAILKSQNFEV